MGASDEDRQSDLARKVMEKAGYGPERLAEEIDKKKAEYDMLTDEGALTLLANELGVVVDDDGQAPTMMIGDLKPGMQNLDVVGRVVRINQPRDFTRRDGSTGYVCSILLSDRTGTIRLTLWDQECRILEQVKEGDTLRIIGGICRSGLRGCEIHTARRARFVLNPQVVEDPRVADLETVTGPTKPELTRKRISELKEGDMDIEVRGTIVRFYRVWIYDACPNCGRKVTGNQCTVCGQVSPTPRAILDLGVDDSTGFLRSKFFGEVVEKFLGVKASEIRSKVEGLIEMGMDRRRASEEYLYRNHLDLLGKELLLQGRVVADEFRGPVLSVDDIAAPDPVEETKKVLAEVAP